MSVTLRAILRCGSTALPQSSYHTVCMLYHLCSFLPDWKRKGCPLRYIWCWFHKFAHSFGNSSPLFVLGNIQDQLRNQSNTFSQNLVNCLLTLSYFIYGTILLVEPDMICDSQRGTGLYVWFIITYVIYAVTCLGIICAMIFLAWLATPQKSVEGQSESDPLQSPLTYQAEEPSKSV
jgi:hypothetical protein